MLTPLSFLESCRRALSVPAFYAELKKRPLKRAFLYLFQWSALLMLVLGVGAAIAGHQILRKEVPAFSESIKTTYPEALVMSFEGQALTVNQTDPVYFETPAFFEELEAKVEDEGTAEISEFAPMPANMVVVDASVEGAVDLEAFAAYDTLILLTKNQILIRDDQGSVSMQTYPEGTFVLDHAKVSQGVDFALTWILRWIYVGLGIFVLLAIPFYFLSKVIYFAVLGGILFFLSKFFAWQLSFKHAYAVTVYAASCAFILQGLHLFGIFFLPLPPVPGWIFFYLTLAWGFVMMQLSSKKGKA